MFIIIAKIVTDICITIKARIGDNAIVALLCAFLNVL